MSIGGSSIIWLTQSSSLLERNSWPYRRILNLVAWERPTVSIRTALTVLFTSLPLLALRWGLHVFIKESSIVFKCSVWRFALLISATNTAWCLSSRWNFGCKCSHGKAHPAWAVPLFQVRLEAGICWVSSCITAYRGGCSSAAKCLREQRPMAKLVMAKFDEHFISIRNIIYKRAPFESSASWQKVWKHSSGSCMS